MAKRRRRALQQIVIEFRPPLSGSELDAIDDFLVRRFRERVSRVFLARKTREPKSAALKRAILAAEDRLRKLKEEMDRVNMA